MKPTMKIRWVNRIAMVKDPVDLVYYSRPETVLQQWWESQTVAEEYHEDGRVSIKLVSDGGEWRDVPTEVEEPKDA